MGKFKRRKGIGPFTGLFGSDEKKIDRTSDIFIKRRVEDLQPLFFKHPF